VVTTSGLLFVAYLGFNVVCSMAPEVRDASRTIPRAIVVSMAVVAVVYLGVVIALLAGGIHTYDEASVGRAAEHLMGHWGGVLIPIGAVVSTLSAANANVLGSSEIMVRLASMRDVPTVLGRMWRGHPAVSVLGGAVVYIVLLLVGHGEAIVALANVAAIAAMAVINIGAIAAQRDAESPGMRLPFGPVLPVLGLVTALAQLVFIPVLDTAVGLVMLALGLVIYALRHRMHRPEHHEQVREHVERGDTPAARAIGGRRSAGAGSTGRQSDRVPVGRSSASGPASADDHESPVRRAACTRRTASRPSRSRPTARIVSDRAAEHRHSRHHDPTTVAWSRTSRTAASPRPSPVASYSSGSSGRRCHR
jgi:hypothetical protein